MNRQGFRRLIPFGQRPSTRAHRAFVKARMPKDYREKERARAEAKKAAMRLALGFPMKLNDEEGWE